MHKASLGLKGQQCSCHLHDMTGRQAMLEWVNSRAVSAPPLRHLRRSTRTVYIWEGLGEALHLYPLTR